MSIKDNEFKLDNLLKYFNNIKEDVDLASYETFSNDRRRIDAVVFNILKISWLTKKIHSESPDFFRDAGMTKAEINRLIKIGNVINSYSSDSRNIWLIASSQLTRFEEKLNKYHRDM